MSVTYNYKTRDGIYRNISTLINGGGSNPTVVDTITRYNSFPSSFLPSFDIEKVSSKTNFGYQLNGSDVATKCTAKYSLYLYADVQSATTIIIEEWCTAISFILIGGGGAGGSGGWRSSEGWGSGGGGGGSGGIIVSRIINVSSTDIIKLTVGNNGSCSQPDDNTGTLNPKLTENGTNGGDTVLEINTNKYTAGGGKGGISGTNGTTNLIGNYNATQKISGTGGTGGTVPPANSSTIFFSQAGSNGVSAVQHSGTLNANGVTLSITGGSFSFGTTGGKGGGRTMDVSTYHMNYNGTGGGGGIAKNPYQQGGDVGNSTQIDHASGGVGYGCGGGGGGGGIVNTVGSRQGGRGGKGEVGYAIIYFYP
jgi:hypothetical protein